MQTVTKHARSQSKQVCSFGVCCTGSAGRPFVLKDSTGKQRTKLQSFSGAFGTGTTSHRSFECEKNSDMLSDFAELIKNGCFFSPVKLKSAEKENVSSV